MFSALKRLTKMGSDDSKLSMPTGVRAMGQALQRKFARGIQYNMKIVIKGDRNTGKTCMFHRLHGKPFNEQYIPTSEIQVGSIHWNYRATDDVVKVELWDVVDVGKSKKKSRDSLKLDNDDSKEEDETVLDAAFLDVYKGTHGVLMLLDITKPWTFQYVRRELPKVPAHIPVLVLSNHRDMGEHRLVDAEEITSFIENLERPDRSPPIHYAESSMKDGFGLKYIHTFLSFPFLMLQREALLQQLQVNAVDMESTLEELQIHKESEEQDYDKFLNFIDKRKREQEARIVAEAEAVAAQATGEGQAGQSSNPSQGSASPPATTSTDKPAVNTTNGESRGSLMKRWFSSSKTTVSNEEIIPRQLHTSPSATNIEEFRPDDELDAGFLAEEATAREKARTKKKPPLKQVEIPDTPSDSSEESNSDSNTRNPMVAGFTEDISSDDEDVAIATNTVPNGSLDDQAEDRKKAENKSRPVKPVITDVVITSSEEEEEEEVVKPIPKAPTQPKSQPLARKKPAGLKLDIKGSTNDSHDDTRRGQNDVDSWLNSPELEPKIPFGSPTEYTVRKVDVDSPEPPVAEQPAISMDDWDTFISQQMSTHNKPKQTVSLLDIDEQDEDDEPGDESKRHRKKEQKSGEKSRSKHKHKKHKDSRDDNDEGQKEKRRSKHKDGERKKSRDDDSERKKKSKHKHSKKKSTDSGTAEGVTYEEL